MLAMVFSERRKSSMEKDTLVDRIIIPKPRLPAELEAGLPLWNIPHLVAHRGLGKHAPGQERLGPENTIPAIKALRQLGWTSFETDAAPNVLSLEVQSRKESHTIFMVHSDDPLERTTNGEGSPFEKTRDYMFSLDAGSYHSDKFKQTGIPTLEEMIQTAKQEGLLSLIEMKVPHPYPFPEENLEISREIGAIMAHAMDELFKDSDVPPLLSFSDAALQAAREMAPRVPLVRNIRMNEDLNEDTWPEWSQKLKELGVIAIDPDHRLLTKELVELAHKDGFRVMTYLSNDSEGLTPKPGEARVDEVERIKELNTWGVDTIITDLVHKVIPG